MLAPLPTDQHPTIALRPTAPPSNGRKPTEPKKESSCLTTEVTPITSAVHSDHALQSKTAGILISKPREADNQMDIDIGWRKTPQPMDTDNGEEKDSI